MSQRLEQLGLGPLAHTGATMLVNRFGPDVIRFRRGYRDLHGQARDMAPNVRRNKEWIKQTYTRTDRPSYAIACALQEAVYRHVDVNDVRAIEEYLYQVLVSRADGGEISFHTIRKHGLPAAEAFDLDPLEDAGGLTPVGFEVADAIRRLPGLDAFKRREGGLVIWHAQFKEQSVSV